MDAAYNAKNKKKPIALAKCPGPSKKFQNDPLSKQWKESKSNMKLQKTGIGRRKNSSFF